MIAVVIDNRAAVRVGVGWAIVAGADADLTELPTTIVEEFVIDWRGAGVHHPLYRYGPAHKEP